MSKTMIVTGASRGIGAAVARVGARLGVNLVVNARSESALDALEESIGPDGDRLATVPGDISEKSTCTRIVDAAMARFGGVDALVNNAGILGPVGALDQVSAEDWARTLAVNVMGPVTLSQAALAPLRERRGRIINLSSGAALKAVRGWSAYCTSKAALNHFNRMLAAEFPEITAIAVSPGMTATDMQVLIRSEAAGRMPEDEHRRFVDAHQKGELRSPDAVARAIVALALNAPHEWSGEFMTVDDSKVRSLARILHQGPRMMAKDRRG
jgi:NAD(P)-dependent dehydrogenase (short-subunit alcohol dehydrogenase family)